MKCYIVKKVNKQNICVHFIYACPFYLTASFQVATKRDFKIFFVCVSKLLREEINIIFKKTKGNGNYAIIPQEKQTT